MKILLPVDGSDCSKRMVIYVATETSLFGTRHEYIIFTVVPVIAMRAIDHHKYRDLEDYCRGEADKVLSPLRDFFNPMLGKITEGHAYGHEAEEIVKFASREKIDLLVMGSHGHSAVKNLMLGSVPNGVMERCNIPVLLIR